MKKGWRGLLRVKCVCKEQTECSRCAQPRQTALCSQWLCREKETWTRIVLCNLSPQLTSYSVYMCVWGAHTPLLAHHSRKWNYNSMLQHIRGGLCMPSFKDPLNKFPDFSLNFTDYNAECSWPIVHRKTSCLWAELITAHSILNPWVWGFYLPI